MTRRCGNAPDPRLKRKITEVVMADGFVAYRTDDPTEQRAAEHIRDLLARKPGATVREVPK